MQLGQNRFTRGRGRAEQQHTARARRSWRDRFCIDVEDDEAGEKRTAAQGCCLPALTSTDAWAGLPSSRTATELSFFRTASPCTDFLAPSHRQ